LLESYCVRHGGTLESTCYCIFSVASIRTTLAIDDNSLSNKVPTIESTYEGTATKRKQDYFKK